MRHIQNIKYTTTSYLVVLTIFLLYKMGLFDCSPKYTCRTFTSVMLPIIVDLATARTMSQIVGKYYCSLILSLTQQPIT